MAKDALLHTLVDVDQIKRFLRLRPVTCDGRHHAAGFAGSTGSAAMASAGVARLKNPVIGTEDM